MKFLLAACLLFAPTTAFQMSMNHRSPLSHQYKSITSVHNSLISGNNMIRMAPPPGEPEPE
eukprot:scaffold10783_cov133-Skeletonema_dohrnii-CCMP3373.AAC.7